jgi:hypothetical protein
MQQPIRVRAKRGVLVPVPRLHGGIAQYVGREIDNVAFDRGETDLELLYPISKEFTEFSVKHHGPEVMTEIRRALRDGDLLEERKEPAKTLAQEHPAPVAKGKA